MVKADDQSRVEGDSKTPLDHDCQESYTQLRGQFALTTNGAPLVFEPSICKRDISTYVNMRGRRLPLAYDSFLATSMWDREQYKTVGLKRC